MTLIMKKAIKTILLIVIIIGLILFAYQKDVERKRQIILKGNVYKEYSRFRDSTKLIIGAYKDTLRVIRVQKKE